MNIVLYQPEIPHNTGAIGRTCLVTNSSLHLIRPYGFHLDEKSRKRAGLDYWDKIRVYEYDDFQDFLDKNINLNMYFIETMGNKLYSEAVFNENDYLIFGSETKGLPQKLINEYIEHVIKIPMIGEARSLNLSVSVGIVLYEALKQTGFKL